MLHFAMFSADFTCVNGSKNQLVLRKLQLRIILTGFLIKIFKKNFSVYCSFVTLAQNTFLRLQIARF